MLGSINPVVNGNRRLSLLMAGFHVLGTSLAALLLGFVILLLPMVEATGPGLWLAVAFMLFFVLADTVGLRLRLRQPSWQVPPSWRDKYPKAWGFPFLWGTLLGLGFTTIAPSSALYLIGILVLTSPKLAAVAIATFGLVRGMSVLVGQLASESRSPASLVTGVWRLTQIARLANAVVGAALIAVLVIH